jgi:beta-lactamase regulating signal transducer with metallopeptidase domain
VTALTTTPAQLVAASIAWMLLHSVWQGALVGILAVVGRRIASSSAYRALIGTVALVVFLAAQAITLVIILQHAEPTFAMSQAEVERVLADTRDDGFMRRIAVPRGLASRWVDRGLWLAPYFTVAWSIVLVALFARALIAMWIVHRLLRRSRPVEEPRRGRFFELSRALDIRRPIAFAETDYSTVPVVAGIRAPTVLLPPAGVLSLAESQVEALVLHELAHVRRRDVAASVGRAFVGCLYFFHPAIALIRRLVEHDAEEAADELAAIALGDRPAYAAALLALVQRRQASALILGAAGGSLRHRIVNVLRGPRESRRRNGTTLFGTTAAALLGLFVIGQLLGAEAKHRAELAWIESHDLASAVVTTLTTNAGSPAFDEALRQCVVDVRLRGKVSESSRAALNAAALVAAPADRMYRQLCATGIPGKHPDFGTFGTVAEQNAIVDSLAVSAHDERSARAVVIIAAVCSLGDSTVRLRNLIGDPKLTRMMRLSSHQFYRLQLARSVFSERGLRVVTVLMKLRRQGWTSEEAGLVWRELRYLPHIEMREACGAPTAIWPAVIAVDDRLNAGQSYALLRRVTADHRARP